MALRGTVHTCGVYSSMNVNSVAFRDCVVRVGVLGMNSIFTVLYCELYVSQARWLHGLRPGVDPGYGDSEPCL